MIIKDNTCALVVIVKCYNFRFMMGDDGEEDIVDDDMDASEEEGKRAVTYQVRL